MSLRVPEGYRLKKGVDLWEFVRDVRAKAEKRIQKRLIGLYEEFDKAGREDLGKLNETLVALGLPEDRKLTKCDYWELGFAFLRMFQTQHPRMEKSPFGMDVALTFRKHQGRYAVLPIANGMMNRTLEFLEDHPSLESYWICTSGDRPSRIPEKEWRAREKFWSSLSVGSTWRDSLSLEILTPSTFWDIDPSRDMIRKDPRAVTRHTL